MREKRKIHEKETHIAMAQSDSKTPRIP